MARHVEPLSGGLVTSREPTVLAEGELSRCDNATYRPNSQALVRSPGRSLYASAVSGGDVMGVRTMRFDNDQLFVVAHASSNYYYSRVTNVLDGSVGTVFTNFDTVLPGGFLEAIQYNNRYFLLNGANAPRVAYLSATATATNPSVRAMGLLPVTETPNAVTAAGVWQLTTTGYFEYWTTEVATYKQDDAVLELESTFGDGTVGYNPATVFVSNAASKVVITRPAVVNTTTASKWRLYRSPVKTTPNDKQFPIGFLVSDFDIATTTAADGQSAATAFQFVTNATSTTTPAWANATAIHQDDSVFTTTTVSTLETATIVADLPSLSAADPIAGIEATIECQRSAGSGTLTVAIGQLLFSVPVILASKVVPITSGMTVITLGGINDNWGINPTAALFNGGLKVFLIAKGYFGGPTTFSADYIKLRVYQGGTLTAATTPFNSVILDIGGNTSAVGAASPPPRCSTGDVFEDAVVVNDKTNNSLIRYSMPGSPEYFPSLYFVDFETSENDVVTNIKNLNNRCIVGLRNSVWRLNYLPNEDDASFNRGRAIELISGDTGIINEMSASMFTGVGGRTELAFAGYNGIWSTDGFSVRELTTDFNWRDYFTGVNWSTLKCALVNNPQMWELVFYFVHPVYGSQNLRLHYHPSHLKEGGRLKISGPSDTRNFDGGLNTASFSSVWPAQLISGNTVTYIGYNGSATVGGGAVFREVPLTVGGGGGTYPSNAYGLADVWTRRMFLAGFGNEWKLKDLHVFRPDTSFQTIGIYLFGLKTNGDEKLLGSKQLVSTTPTQIPFGKVSFNVGTEGVRVALGQGLNQATFNAEFLVIDGTDFGAEQSGK